MIKNGIATSSNGTSGFSGKKKELSDQDKKRLKFYIDRYRNGAKLEEIPEEIRERVVTEDLS